MRVDFKKLEEEQIRLAKKLVLKDDFSEINRIAGVDHAYNKDMIISGIVVCDYSTMSIIEKKFAIMKARMQYFPRFLGYREAPVIVEAYNNLVNKPDVLVVEAHGVSHPRKFGMASQIGLALDIPTIGVAKKMLDGEVKDNKIIIGNEIRGAVLRTKEHANPLFVSIGHRISLETAVKIINECMRQPHKLPEPLHLAHRYADKVKGMQQDE